MWRDTPIGSIDGEIEYVHIRDSANDGEAAALPQHADEEGLPVRCALSITNYRVVIQPVTNKGSSGLNFFLPLLSIGTWSVPRGSMTPVYRAVFQRGRGQQLSEVDTTPYPSDAPPSLTENNVQTSIHTLKICTKYLWEVEVVLQGERVARTVSDLRPLFSVTHIKSMPAFAIYRERYSKRCEVKDSENNYKEQKQDQHNSNEWEGKYDYSGVNMITGTEPLEAVEFGWNLYDPDRELERQLCLSPGSDVPSIEDMSRVGPRRDLRPWFRLTCANQPLNSYGKSPTYPFRVVAPNAASDNLIEDAMSARSRARFPAISFVHLATGAVLARTSQPLLKSPKLRQDSELCHMFTNNGYHAHNAEPRREPLAVGPSEIGSGGGNGNSRNKMVPPPSLFETNSEEGELRMTGVTQQNVVPMPRRQRTLVVADCRPQAAAWANQKLGGGFESGPSYSFCEVKFHGIENIHGVMQSFSKLKSLIQQFNGKQPRDDFLSQLNDTKWLRHVQRILMCSSEIAGGLDRGESYLVHCTDGWDRTPQCVATAMLLLDPFYRTIVGFCVLVEKEFCSFGHKFAERCGHQVYGDTSYVSDNGVSASDTDVHSSSSSSSSGKLQPSPIFLLWMDVVFQVVRQFPRYFEFTPKLLEYLAETVYACLYGTFLCNGERERMFEGVRLNTASVWTDICCAARRERAGESPLYFVNDSYDSVTAWEYISKEKGCGIQRISPSCSSKRIVFWESFYLRYDKDRYSLDLGEESEQVAKRVVFHDAWEYYFDKFLKDSCVLRRKDVVEMRNLLKNINVPRAPLPVSSPQTKNDSKVCNHCHKRIGIFSRELCSRCRSAMCENCTVDLDKGVKMCRNCYKDHEWYS
ncbi:putative zinc-binding phosphatase [Trypanosoma theileri]|uniref:Putative zinc-binding phosphatase n=1 Tax=Trypanosoma theileri TaxID=67003 RepID=A0A1X0NW48_9TRYP|nr:putative zinc-binding phosphatase [Trypanosoma theileri]ORC88926.1 putative zinc-binding phosphatase [Trypanosoma theileri]